MSYHFKKLSIRNGTFETNSSSMHTLVLCGSTYDDSIIEGISHNCFGKNEYDDGTFDLVLHAGWFQQDCEILRSWPDKLRYVIAAFSIEKAYTFLQEIAKEIPGCRNIYLSGIYGYDIEFFKDTSLQVLSAYREGDYDFTGSIDHQSYDLPSDILELITSINPNLDEVSAFKEFIFSPKYAVITDSDCNDFAGEIIISGLFNLGVEKILRKEYDDDNYEHYTLRLIDAEEYINEGDEE